MLPKPQNSEHIMSKCDACQIHNFAQLSFEKKGLFSERHQAEATKAGSKCLAEARKKSIKASASEKKKIEEKSPTSTTGTPRKTKGCKIMVQTRHRNDDGDEAVEQSGVS